MNDVSIMRNRAYPGSIKRGFSIVVLLFFVVINLLLYSFFTTEYVASNISFFINFLFLCLFFTYLCLTNYSIFSTVFFVFFYIFLWLAPLLQTHTLRYPNTMQFDEHLVVCTNLICLLYGMLFLLTRVYLYRSHITRLRNYINYNFNNKVILITIALSLIALMLFRDRVFRFSFFVSEVQEYESPIALILDKFFFFIPVFLPAYVLVNRDKFRNKLTYLPILSIAIFYCFIFLNPLNTKRNVLGPLYLSFIYYYYIKIINKNLISVVLLIVIFLFGFAIVGRITNSVELTSFLEIPSYLNKAFGQIDFVGELRTLHYDAWSELLATVKYVQVYGLTYGKQLLGVLFFFVPRSIWPDKPVGSGHLVAQNLLMTQYDMWFTNLSNPLPSEGYINFGIIGVALFAIILGKVSE